MQVKIAINGSLHTLTFTTWRELWRWLAKATASHSSVEPIRVISISIKGH